MDKNQLDTDTAGEKPVYQRAAGRLFPAGNPGGALQLAATSATVHHGTAADKRVQRRTLSTRR